MSEEKYSVANCSVCTHERRNEIEEKLITGLHTQKSIAQEFNISEPSLSNHKNKHMLDTLKDNLKCIIFERIKRGALKDASFSEIISALKYIEEDNKQLNITPLKSVDEAINDYLGLNEDVSPLMDYICINPEEYQQFADFMRNAKEDIQLLVCPRTYQKFKILKK